MKIAILTSGILPVPAVQGGAAENLIDYYLAYNDRHHLHDMTVYSVYHPAVEKHPALRSQANHYIYIKRYDWVSRLKAKVYGMIHKNEYYHYQLEYFFEQAYAELSKQSFDLIILENRPGYALKLRQRLTTPIVSHIHTDLINPQTAQVEAIIQSTNGFIGVSEYIRAQILSVGIPTKAFVVYNGLDEQKFRPQAYSAVTREALGFSETDFVVIYTGRIVPKKGVKELVQAVSLLTDQPDIKLLVVGGDNYADSVSSNPYLDQLHALGRQMPGRVCFTGFRPYGQLPAYLRLADVAVVPSRINEALGMTCLEAVAMGLPVIATNDGGIPETLAGQKHILIDKDGDLPRQIADAIVKVKSNYADFAGNRLETPFTKEVYAKSFLETICRYG